MSQGSPLPKAMIWTLDYTTTYSCLLNSLLRKNGNVQISLSCFLFVQLCQSNDSGSSSKGEFFFLSFIQLVSFIVTVTKHKYWKKEWHKTFLQNFLELCGGDLTFLFCKRVGKPNTEGGKKEAVKKKIFATSPEFLDYFSCGLIFPWWEAVLESNKYCMN